MLFFWTRVVVVAVIVVFTCISAAVPYSKGGKTAVENCQILQSRTNKLKGNKENVSMQEMKQWSCATLFTTEMLDTLEMAMYGNVKRPERKCNCHTIGEFQKMFEKNTITPKQAAASNFCV